MTTSTVTYGLKAIATTRNESERNRNGNGVKMSHRVVDHVITNISNGSYAPASQISPKEIAKQLNVSSAPVRDAIEQLENQGWIERLPNKGTYVRNFTIKDIEEIYEFRGMMEAETVRIVTKRIKPEQLTKLESIVDALIKATEENDVATYKDHDNEFHMFLVQCTGNQRLQNNFYSILLQARFFFQHVAQKVTSSETGRPSGNLEDTPISHKRIYEAIKAGDGDLAVQLIRRHVKTACEWNKTMVKVHQLSDIEHAF